MAAMGMILAAGRGERMRPLTDSTPKPLLRVGGKRLIEYQIERLRAVGCARIVINQGWLGEQLPEALGDGSAYGVELHYSDETAFPSALETAGGIRHALELLADEFYVVNGDVFCDADLNSLTLTNSDLACLQLVPNPAHNPDGDFPVDKGRVVADGGDKFTFSGEGLYRREMFAALPLGRAALRPLFDSAIQANSLSAVVHQGRWFDIGTPERLAALDALLT